MRGGGDGVGVTRDGDGEGRGGKRLRLASISAVPLSTLCGVLGVEKKMKKVRHKCVCSDRKDTHYSSYNSSSKMHALEHLAI